MRKTVGAVTQRMINSLKLDPPHIVVGTPQTVWCLRCSPVRFDPLAALCSCEFSACFRFFRFYVVLIVSCVAFVCAAERNHSIKVICWRSADGGRGRGRPRRVAMESTVSGSAFENTDICGTPATSCVCWCDHNRWAVQRSETVLAQVRSCFLSVFVCSPVTRMRSWAVYLQVLPFLLANRIHSAVCQ